MASAITMSGFTFPLPAKAIVRSVVRATLARGGSTHNAAYHVNCLGIRIRCNNQPVRSHRTRCVTKRDADAVAYGDDLRIDFVVAQVAS